MTETGVEELIRLYTLAGVEDWRDWRRSGSRMAQPNLERILGARISASPADAMQVVYQRNADFVPAKRLAASNIEWAFFRPHREQGAEWMFDVALWLPGRNHILFRLEPPGQRFNSRHRYNHVQLSRRGKGGSPRPQEPHEWLPDSYPAFPIPGRSSLDRFLMLIVALHGFPACTRTVLSDMWGGRPSKVREHIRRVANLLDST